MNTKDMKLDVSNLINKDASRKKVVLKKPIEALVDFESIDLKGLNNKGF